MTGETIDLKKFERQKKKKTEEPKKEDKSATDANKKKRRRIKKTPAANVRGRGGNAGKSQRGRKAIIKEEPSEAEVQKQVRETLEKLQGKTKKGKGAKYRRDKRDLHRAQSEKDMEQQAAESKVLKVTEFVTVSEIATMMNIPVTDIISTCMSLGMMVTMNQRLDAETLTIVAEEFEYTVNFVGAEVEESIQEVEDLVEDLKPPTGPILIIRRHLLFTWDLNGMPWIIKGVQLPGIPVFLPLILKRFLKEWKGCFMILRTKPFLKLQKGL